MTNLRATSLRATSAAERVAGLADRVWTPHTAAERVARAVLVPASFAYGAVAAMRNRLYDARWLAVARVPALVVSVGNLTVGGSGKTPAALWLAARLAAGGRRTAIVARGYRKRRRGVVVVGEAGRPLVAPEEGGDEAVMLAHRFAGPVVAGERRAAAAAYACARFAVDTIVLDDGFQHRALARDADLVLATTASADARLLPAGPLREPRSSLARARAVLAIGGAPPPSDAPSFRGALRPTALVRAVGDDWRVEPLDAVRGVRVLAVAGVARPERFFATLAGAGATVAATVAFADHHAYAAADAVRLAAEAAGLPIVTTEKDLVKLARFPALRDVRALRVELEVEDGERLLEVLTR